MLSQRCHSSKRDGAAGLQRLQCGVRQRQCLDPVAAGLRHRTAGQRVDKMVELPPVGLGFTLLIERFLKADMLAKLG